MHEVKLPALKETYEIKVKGNLDSKWESWFEGFKIVHKTKDTTLLSGSVADQAALHGILGKVRDLGLHLVFVKQVKKE